jgi:hypothetical protein
MAIALNGLHFLLTYRCTSECEHCFVWGSPNQTGTMTLAQVRDILKQGREVGTIEWIYFEGGEPFLFYVLLRASVESAASMGFKVGIVTNGYWATSVDDAMEYLRPLAPHMRDLSVSSDLYHSATDESPEAAHVRTAAGLLGMPADTISIAQPNVMHAACATGQLPAGQSSVRFRGRAAVELAGRAPRRPWSSFTECPYENLADPGRVHVDPFGHLHICQGVSIGNLFREPLVEILAKFDPRQHPITASLFEGGPARLTSRYSLPYSMGYADACHLCYEMRSMLRALPRRACARPDVRGDGRRQLIGLPPAATRAAGLPLSVRRDRSSRVRESSS